MRSGKVQTLVYGTDLGAAVAAVRPELAAAGVRLLPCSASLGFPPAASVALAAAGPAPSTVADLMALATSPAPVPAALRRGVRPTDAWAFVYSSGSSGQPKVRGALGAVVGAVVVGPSLPY